jgi:hypothetical protein
MKIRQEQILRSIKLVLKKTSNKNPAETDDMLPEYDFSKMMNGVRGKCHQAYREGHTIKINKSDGTVEVHYFTLEDGAVMLEPDVQEYFSDSQAVNNALRNLIALIPEKHQPIKSK